MQKQEQYNQWFARMVEKHCPKTFHEIKSHSDNGVAYLTAVINDPRGDRYKIAVSTYGCELTVTCDNWHGHFDMFDDDNHESEFSRVLNWIKEFQEDGIVIFTEYDGDRIIHIMSAESGFKFQPSHARRATVFSFSGKLDRTIGS